MKQVEIPIQGQGLDDITNVVLISHRKFLSMNEEIKKVDKQKSMANKKFIDLRKRLFYQKCRHDNKEGIREILEGIPDRKEFVEGIKENERNTRAMGEKETWHCYEKNQTIFTRVEITNILSHFKINDKDRWTSCLGPSLLNSI
ncbi:cilia- and flagella-associated protein 43-like [Vespula maculifrons]|uniref:Cilia- and flagella-associated protein 43-like n=1 Tax=Vespula maculifrons TaxID=7453 RepID=A0ABD2CFC2_VESMC